MKSKVVLVRCESYEVELVRKAVARGMELMGGVQNFVKQGEKILLKVNLLAADVPQKCVTTHPAVFRAVAEQFKTAGAVLSYGDSPGIGTPRAAAKKAGITEVADELSLIAADFKEIEKYKKDLSSILDYIEKLKKVDFSETKETSHPLFIENVFRKDEVSRFDKKLIDGHLKVKSILR